MCKKAQYCIFTQIAVQKERFSGKKACCTPKFGRGKLSTIMCKCEEYNKFKEVDEKAAGKALPVKCWYGFCKDEEESENL